LESVQNQFKIVQSEKSVKIQKTKTKNENEKPNRKRKTRKLIKIGTLTQNRLEPMENRLECSRRFPKPEKTRKM
jgi:hypothetical protein